MVVHNGAKTQIQFESLHQDFFIIMKIYLVVLVILNIGNDFQFLLLLLLLFFFFTVYEKAYAEFQKLK